LHYAGHGVSHPHPFAPFIGAVSGLVFSRSPDLYFILFHIEIIEMCVDIEMHAHLDRVSGRGRERGGERPRHPVSSELGWYDLLLSVTA